jgi:WD40 repeat protein
MIDDDVSSADPFGAIADEFVAAFRQGKRPSVEEFVRRYPAHAAEIRTMLPTLVLMEQAKPADDTSSAQRRVKAVAATAPLSQLGDYQILREVGRGGMGVVYEALQLSLGRHVAIKVLPSHGLLDPKQLRRFQREAKAAARLHHTNIVPVFGVGEHEGLHYYVMQFIPGLGLDKVLKELRRLPPGGKGSGSAPQATVGKVPVSRHEVCSADVAESLRTGPFTRSLAEAANVSVPGPAVTGDQAAPEAPAAATRASDSFTLSSSVVLPGTASGKRRMTYWQSVARVGVQVADALAYAAGQGILHRDIKPSNLLLDGRGNVWVTDFGLAKAAGDSADLTRTGDVVGTLRYMAPERFSGRGDFRSDVYSLGLTLYELLALRPAFQEKDRSRLIQQVTMTEPPRLDRLNPDVPRDLVTIIHKAIDRDAAHRYPAAADLAADLQRFLDDEPIHARRVAPAERFLRWCRRNPVVASLVAAVAVLLVGVAGVATVAAFRIAGARDEATRNAREALVAKESEAAERQLAEANARESRQRLIQLQVANGTRLLDDGDLFGALPWLTGALTLDQGDPARAERHRTRIAAVLAQTPRLVHVWKHDHEVRHAAFSPDGRRVVTASRDGTARVWDVATGEPVTPPLRHGGSVLKAAFSPDSRRVVTACHDGTARVWDAHSGQSVGPALPHAAMVQDVSFSPDGRWIVTATTDGTATVWDAVTGQPHSQPMKHRLWLHSVAFSPDGRQVVTASHDGTAQVWDAATGRPAAPRLVHGAAVISAAFSPDGRRVVTASDDHTARLWDAVTGQAVGSPLEHGDRVLRAAFSPDGRYIATCSYDRTARVWDAATGKVVSPPLTHLNSVRSALFSPNSRYVVTRSNDHTARIWEAATGWPVTPPLRHSWLVSSACFSPDGRRVVTASADGTVRMWDLVGRGEAPVTCRHDQEVSWFAFSPDGRSLVTASVDGTARVWDAVSGQPVTGPLRHERAVSQASFSADGRRVVTASDDHTARVWHVATGRELIPPLRHQAGVVQATFSPEGERVLTASADHTAQVWDAHTVRTAPGWPSVAMTARSASSTGPARKY